MSQRIRHQIEALQREFVSRPAGLRRHVERVLVEALDLARRFDVDGDRVELAVWGHDLFRAHAPAELLALAREAGVPIAPEDEAEPVLLHGPIAAVVLRERFAVTDDDAIAAVRDHTLGLAEMPIIAKVILIADKVEERKRRRTPVMSEDSPPRPPRSRYGAALLGRLEVDRGTRARVEQPPGALGRPYGLGPRAPPRYGTAAA